MTARNARPGLRPWRRSGEGVRDAGFTMIELMVSMTILALVSASFAYGLELAMSVTREDRARVQATNLAARELESGERYCLAHRVEDAGREEIVAFNDWAIAELRAP